MDFFLDKKYHSLLYYPCQADVPGFFELLKILTSLATYDIVF